MAYLDELSAAYNVKNDEQLIEYRLEACTYPAYYRYWTNELFERLMRLFVWENTFEVSDGKIVGVQPKQIESRLILRGFSVISKLKPSDKELTAFFGSMFDPTKYYDEWKQVVIRCPLYSGTRVIGKDAIIIDNTDIRTPTYMHVHHYATLLAHTEVTLVDMLVDARDNGGVPIARTQKQFESIRAYQNKRFIGKYGVVTDIGGVGVDYVGSDRKTSQNISEIVETRNKLIRAFYSDIGVRSNFEKRSNVNSAEVEGNTSMLEFNVSDMLHQRELGAEKVNNLFGTNWSVHIADEIDYERIEKEEREFDMQQSQFSQLKEEGGEKNDDDTEQS